MEKTFDVEKAIQAQQEYCKEYAANHPEDWASDSMSKGIGFAPKDGRCFCCKQQIYSADGQASLGGRRPTGRKVEGISVEQARKSLVTGCPFCHRSYVD